MVNNKFHTSQTSGAKFSGRFASRAILSRFKNGVIIGRKRALSKAESYRNILIAGATGAGKTSVIKNNLYRWGEQIKGRKQISIPIISSIYNFIRPHGFDSYVLVDLDGSGYRETAGWLKKCGADIYRLDFSGNNPLQTMHFNFIENAKGDKDQTKEICDFLCHTGGKSDFWDISSSELDTLFSIAISQCQDKNLRHVGNTRFLINTLLTAPKELDQWILDHVTDEGLRAEYLAIKGLDERLKGNIVKSATASLDAYKIEAIQKIMCGTGQQFAPSLLRRPGKPTILYITMPESKLINRHYRNQIGIIFNQMMDSFFTDGMGGNPAYGGCCFILDEAGILAASGALPHLDSQLTQGRKHKISNILITQDLGFFTSYFGEGRSKALLAGGIVTRVFLSWLSESMTAQISQLLGKVKRFDFKTMRHIEEDLLTPDNIRMLDDKSAIVIHGNKRPILLKKEWTPFFKIRKYRRRSKMKAPVIHYQKEGEGSPELIDLQEYAPREPQKEKELTLSLDDWEEREKTIQDIEQGKWDGLEL